MTFKFLLVPALLLGSMASQAGEFHFYGGFGYMIDSDILVVKNTQYVEPYRDWGPIFGVMEFEYRINRVSASILHISDVQLHDKGATMATAKYKFF